MGNKPTTDEIIECPQFEWKISKSSCCPGKYPACKRCRRNPKSTQKQKSTQTIYCRVIRQKIVKKRCSPGEHPNCAKCPPIQHKAQYLVNQKVFPPFTENDFSKFEKILKVPRFSLSLTTISKLIDWKDYLIMETQTIKPKKSEIKTDLQMVRDKAKSYAESLANLLNIPLEARPGRKSINKAEKKDFGARINLLRREAVRYILEKELYPMEQSEGLKNCPFCEEEFENLPDHLSKCHRGKIVKNKVAPTKEEIDFIERSYSDVHRVYLAADKAIKKQESLLDKGGRPKKVGLKIVIEKLSLIFIETTGTPPNSYYNKWTYRGPFFKFVEVFIKRIFNQRTLRPPITNSALGQMIELVLNKQKEKGIFLNLPNPS